MVRSRFVESTSLERWGGVGIGFGILLTSMSHFRDFDSLTCFTFVCLYSLLVNGELKLLALELSQVACPQSHSASKLQDGRRRKMDYSTVISWL